MSESSSSQSSSGSYTSTSDSDFDLISTDSFTSEDDEIWSSSSELKEASGDEEGEEEFSVDRTEVDQDFDPNSETPRTSYLLEIAGGSSNVKAPHITAPVTTTHSELFEQYQTCLNDKKRLLIANEIHSCAAELADAESAQKENRSILSLSITILQLIHWEYATLHRRRFSSTSFNHHSASILRSSLSMLLPLIKNCISDYALLENALSIISLHSCIIEYGDPDQDQNANNCTGIKQASALAKLEYVRCITVLWTHLPIKIEEPIALSLIASIHQFCIHDRSITPMATCLQLLALMFENLHKCLVPSSLGERSYLCVVQIFSDIVCIILPQVLFSDTPNQTTILFVTVRYAIGVFQEIVHFIPITAYPQILHLVQKACHLILALFGLHVSLAPHGQPDMASCLGAKQIDSILAFLELLLGSAWPILDLLGEKQRLLSLVSHYPKPSLCSTILALFIQDIHILYQAEALSIIKKEPSPPIVMVVSELLEIVYSSANESVLVVLSRAIPANFFVRKSLKRFLIEQKKFFPIDKVSEKARKSEISSLLDVAFVWSDIELAVTKLKPLFSWGISLQAYWTLVSSFKANNPFFDDLFHECLQKADLEAIPDAWFLLNASIGRSTMAEVFLSVFQKNFHCLGLWIISFYHQAGLRAFSLLYPEIILAEPPNFCETLFDRLLLILDTLETGLRIDFIRAILLFPTHKKTSELVRFLSLAQSSIEKQVIQNDSNIEQILSVVVASILLENDPGGDHSSIVDRFLYMIEEKPNEMTLLRKAVELFILDPMIRSDHAKAVAIEAREWLMTLTGSLGELPAPGSLGAYLEDKSMGVAVGGVLTWTYKESLKLCEGSPVTSDDGLVGKFLSNVESSYIARNPAFVSQWPSILKERIRAGEERLPLPSCGSTATLWADASWLALALKDKGLALSDQMERLERQFGAFVAVQLWERKPLSTAFHRFINLQKEKFASLLLHSIETIIAALLGFCKNEKEEENLSRSLGQLAKSVGFDSPTALFITSTTRCWRVAWKLHLGSRDFTLASLILLRGSPSPEALVRFAKWVPSFVSQPLPQLLLSKQRKHFTDQWAELACAAFQYSTWRHSMMCPIEALVENMRIALLLAMQEGADSTVITSLLSCFKNPRKNGLVDKKWRGDRAIPTGDLRKTDSNISWLQTVVAATGSMAVSAILRIIDIGMKGVGINEGEEMFEHFVLFLANHWPLVLKEQLHEAPPYATIAIGHLLQCQIASAFKDEKGPNSELLKTAIQQLPPGALGWSYAEFLYALLASYDLASITCEQGSPLEETILMKLPELLGYDILPGHLQGGCEEPPSHLSRWNIDYHPQDTAESIVLGRLRIEPDIEQDQTILIQYDLMTKQNPPVIKQQDEDNDTLVRALKICRTSWNRGQSSWAISLLNHHLGTTNPKPSLTRVIAIQQLALWTAEARAAPALAINELFLSAQSHLRQFYHHGDDDDDESFDKEPETPLWPDVLWTTKKKKKLGKLTATGLYAAWAQWADQAAILSERHMDQFLQIALRAYASALSLLSDDGNPTLVLQAAGLWFRESSKEWIHSLVGELFSSAVPARHWLVLVHQLAARLGSSSSSDGAEQKILASLYERMVLYAPFVALYPLIYVAGGPHKTNLACEYQEEKSAFHAFIEKLASGPAAGAFRMALMMAEASVELGTRFPCLKSKHQGPFTLDSSWLVVRLSQRGGIDAPVLTASKTDIRVIGWATSGRILGGINAPKAVDCYGSDGQTYPQLFKARDDLRQDALVLQVMKCIQGASVLGLWQHYPVIPLQKQVGVIGMIQDTISMGEWLGEAHRRLRPQDMSPDQAIRLMADTRNRGEIHDFRKNFDMISALFQPVFRYFFWEATHCAWAGRGAQGWIEARITYSRSVGSSSMLGWVVGLGDRHPNNILISTINGAVCHIDLNLIFEAGRRLKVPELVPFRFTADMRDGLLRRFSSVSISRSFGVFGKAAEDTLNELRSRADLIMMLFEAFRHDPLYHQWRNSPEHADHDLKRLRHKLTNQQLSSEAQIGVLVHEAIDPDALAVMYHGWQGWM